MDQDDEPLRTRLMEANRTGRAPSSDSESSSDEGASAPRQPASEPSSPDEVQGTPDATTDGQPLSSPILPTPNRAGLETQSFEDKVKQKVRMANQRITQCVNHLNDVDAQVATINATIREQKLSLAALTNVLPTIQDQMADLRARVAADTTAKIRTSEQNILDTLTNNRQEMEGAIAGLSTDVRRNLREVRQTVSELQGARNPLLSVQELRTELLNRNFLGISRKFSHTTPNRQYIGSWIHSTPILVEGNV